MTPWVHLLITHGPALIQGLIRAWREVQPAESLEDWLGGFKQPRSREEIYARARERLSDKGFVIDGPLDESLPPVVEELVEVETEILPNASGLPTSFDIMAAALSGHIPADWPESYQRVTRRLSEDLAQ
jgi:hypothetical protein